MKHYQDIWIKGEVVDCGMRECKNRYENVILPILRDIKREDGFINMLDIGAGSGYFSLRAASDFENGTFTMIDSVKIIKEVFEKNNLKNTKLINKKLTVEDIESILNAENFNVILALNILHWYEDWVHAFDVFTENVKYVIIQTPYKDEVTKGTTHNELLEYLHNHDKIKLISDRPSGYEKDRPIFLFKGE